MHLIKKIVYVVIVCVILFCSVRNIHAIDAFEIFQSDEHTPTYFEQTFADFTCKTINWLRMSCGLSPYSFGAYNQEIADEFKAYCQHKVIIDGQEKIFTAIADRLNKAAECNNLHALSETIDTIKYLVQSGEIENALSTEGIRFLGADALHIACEKGYAEIAEKLLKENVFMGVEKNNKRPLHIACHFRHYDVVETLLCHSGANLIMINALNKSGQTPLDLVPADCADIILLLEGYGATRSKQTER